MSIAAKPRVSAKRRRRAAQPAPLTAIVSVPDPFEPGAALGVVVSLRLDVLRQWHARKAIDDAQFAAGRWFQGLYERAEIGGAGALRYDKPKVDGGFPVDPLTEKVVQATADLRALHPVLGTIDYPLVCRIVGQGVSLEEQARHTGWNGCDAVRYIAKRVKDALTVLADHRGAVGPQRSAVRSWRG